MLQNFIEEKKIINLFRSRNTIQRLRIQITSNKYNTKKSTCSVLTLLNFLTNKSSKCIINPNQELCMGTLVHVKALTLMSTSQRKKKNLRTGEIVSHTTHQSYPTFYTSIWENEKKPFFCISTSLQN